MKTAVLGCGPAGLMAVHAITVSTGETPVIVSKARKSELFGAQYLHSPIPMLDVTHGVDGALVDYDLIGDPHGYRTKVYGDLWEDRVSPEDLIGQHYAWDIRSSYSELWDRYGHNVIDLDLGTQPRSNFQEMVAAFDLVISSVPKPLLCRDGHVFASQDVWAIGDAPERGQKCPVRVDYNSVVCNGAEHPSWYRASNVFGYSTVEWPEYAKPPIPGVAAVKKPLFNTCNCFPEIVHVGRYGRWEKGILSHQAYHDAQQALEAL